MSYWSLPIRRGSGGPQKPFSWLSEGVRSVFIVSTESSEKTYIPYLHNLGTTMCSWLVVRAEVKSCVFCSFPQEELTSLHCSIEATSSAWRFWERWSSSSLMSR